MGTDLGLYFQPNYNPLPYKVPVRIHLETSPGTGQPLKQMRLGLETDVLLKKIQQQTIEIFTVSRVNTKHCKRFSGHIWMYEPFRLNDSSNFATLCSKGTIKLSGSFNIQKKNTCDFSSDSNSLVEPCSATCIKPSDAGSPYFQNLKGKV